ncbi:VirB8 protein [Candidatus Arcanobacter lacustris]|uniref:VirB8 protein n=1 Tax=Candidatus Arcanibacter lacustris TaxID=1607817 RepID=A0A0F5MNI0_9RICK|nr:VirB8 protein [Candidatus Arcanobacter lacustris]
MMKYISPVVEKCYALLLAFVFVIAAAAELIFVNNLYVDNIRFVVPITLDDTIDFQPVIKVLNSPIIGNVDPYEVVAEYLVSNYVKVRESYSYHDLEDQLKKIENNSTKHIFKEFYDSISLNNPNSPVLLYQRSANRIIKIKSSTISDDNSVVVSFDAIIEDKHHNNLETTSWVASVAFSMSDINYILQKNSDKFYFFINNYQVQRVQ